MRMCWSCPSPFISAARSTAASAATISFAQSSGAAEKPLLFQTAAAVATCWSGWPVVVIASWSWARATIPFRSSHLNFFNGLQWAMTKVRLPLRELRLSPKSLLEMSAKDQADIRGNLTLARRKLSMSTFRLILLSNEIDRDPLSHIRSQLQRVPIGQAHASVRLRLANLSWLWSAMNTVTFTRQTDPND